MSQYEGDTEPRVIDTWDDARAVLTSQRASFNELIVCAEIFKEQDDWESRKLAAGRAIEEVLRIPATKNRMNYLVRAAQHVALSVLTPASLLPELEAPLVESARCLDEIIRRCTTRFKASTRSELSEIERIDDLRSTIAETLLLISAGPKPDSSSRLAGNLRRLERPDLVVRGVEAGSIPSQRGTSLAVSYSAALLDIGRNADALAAIQSADKSSPGDSYVTVVHSRAHQAHGNTLRALELADEAFALRSARETANRLIAALVIAEQCGIEYASDVRSRHGQRLSRILGEAASGVTDAFFPILAIELLMKDRLLNEARGALAALDSSSLAIPRKLQPRLAQVRNAIRRQTK